MPNIIVIGGSAGAVEAVARLISDLPANLDASLFVVIHFPPSGISVLPDILNRRGRLCAQHPQNGERMRPGYIYVAPPNRHMTVNAEYINIWPGPKENGHRPAIDPLFRSAAQVEGKSVIGVILSGSRDDGSAGLQLIKKNGGITIVQDPNDALFPDMPRHALQSTEVDFVLPLKDLGNKLISLVNGGKQNRVEHISSGKEDAEMENIDNEKTAQIVAEDMVEFEQKGSSGQTSVLTCPECSGVLWEFDDGKLIRYRCHVGHAYSADSLQEASADRLEAALWTALRTLREKRALTLRLASRAHKGGHSLTAGLFEKQAQELEYRETLIEQALQLDERVAQEV